MIDKIDSDFEERELSEEIILPVPPVTPGRKIVFEATEKQQIYIDAVLSGAYRYLLTQEKC